MAGKAWTEAEQQFIRDNYLAMTCAEMANRLSGRTTRAVQHQFAAMGLERPRPKVGDELGRLTILRIYDEDIGTQMCSMADVECRCGTKKNGVRLTTMSQGTTVSCGCWKAEQAANRTRERNRRHGLSDHPLYSQHRGMVGRCTYESHVSYKNYGGRGITVCDEWRNDFRAFYDWAMANGWEPGLTIERKKSDGDYCPENCTFATCEDQANNKRDNRWVTAFGESKTLAMWCKDERCQASYVTVSNRLDLLGWDTERAIATPPRGYNRTFK